MQSRKQPEELQKSGREIKFYLNDSELHEYEEFLKPFAGKKGPYAKAILFKHIREQKQQIAANTTNP